MFNRITKKCNFFQKRLFTNTLNPEFYKSKEFFDLERKKYLIAIGFQLLIQMS